MDWWKQSVVYQVYPRSFMDSNGDGIGDLPGLTARLDYLAELGVDVIWLCPVYQSPNVDGGYDISDYQAIEPVFGGMEDFDRLLEEVHRRGMKLIMDLVVNHTSDQHRWFLESRKGAGSDLDGFYIWRDAPTNWGSAFGGSAWTWDQERGMYYLHLFAPQQPDLNWQNPKARQAVYQMMRWWLDKGVDGFRMDVINMIAKDPAFPDGSPGPTGYADFTPFSVNRPGVHAYLREMNREVLSHYDVMTVGETPAATVEDALLYAGQDTGELNMVFQFELMNLDHGADYKWNDRRPSVRAIRENLEHWQLGLAGRAWNSLFWSNHDEPRVVSRFGDPGKYRVESAKMLATCLHFMRGTPFIFQGEELGMTNYPFSSPEEFRDIESINAWRDLVGGGLMTPEQMMSCLRYMSRDNARTPMQWDAGPNAGFTTGVPWLPVNPNHLEINAEAQRKDPDSVFHYYRRLIALRHSLPVIAGGDFRPVPAGRELIAYTRTLEDQTLLVVCNFSASPAPFSWPEEPGRLLISNYPDAPGKTLRPYEAAVYCYGTLPVEKQIDILDSKQ